MDENIRRQRRHTSRRPLDMSEAETHADGYYLDSEYTDYENDAASGYAETLSEHEVSNETDVRRDTRRMNNARDTYDALEIEERDRYFRERDEYFRERDEYYRRRDEYYDNLNSNSGRGTAPDNSSGKTHPTKKTRSGGNSRPDEKMRRGGNPQPAVKPHADENAKRGEKPRSGGKSQTGGTLDTDKREQSGKKSNKKAVLAVIASILIFIIGFVAFKIFTAKDSGYYTVAVFGVDSREGKLGKGALSDVNMIARVDMGTGEIKLVSIYRDTYTRIDEEGNYHKFNEAYFRGGPEQAIWALEHNTDVKVDDYATFNWKAVVDTINMLGGLDVDITDAEFKYINAFITETVNGTGVGSYQLEHAGPNHLDGVQSVAYARLRLMDNDYVRTERQRKIVSLAMEKAKKADYATLYGILVTVLPQISTSVGVDDILPFVKNIGKYYLGDTVGFPFEKQGHNVGKLDCVVPVTWETNNIALHEFLYPGSEYTPSAISKEISDHVVSVTGLGASGDVSVNVDDLSSGKGSSGGGSAGSSGGTPSGATPNNGGGQNSVTESVEESISEIIVESETIEEIIDPNAEGYEPDSEDAENDGQSSAGNGDGGNISGNGDKLEENDGSGSGNDGNGESSSDGSYGSPSNGNSDNSADGGSNNPGSLTDPSSVSTGSSGDPTNSPGVGQPGGTVTSPGIGSEEDPANQLPDRGNYAIVGAGSASGYSGTSGPGN